MSVFDLPTELLLNIGSRLEKAANVVNFFSLCKGLLPLLTDNTIWKNICRGELHFLFSGQTFTILLPGKDFKEVDPWKNINVSPDYMPTEGWFRFFKEYRLGKVLTGLCQERRMYGDPYSCYLTYVVINDMQTDFLRFPSTHLLPDKIPTSLRSVSFDIVSDSPMHCKETMNNKEVYKIKDEVEIQWRAHSHSFFGWWRGFVEKIHEEDDTITVYFPHFDKDSVWYNVRVNRDGKHRKNLIEKGGGVSERGMLGGIRKVTHDESLFWKKNE